MLMPKEWPETNPSSGRPDWKRTAGAALSYLSSRIIITPLTYMEATNGWSVAVQPNRQQPLI